MRSVYRKFLQPVTAIPLLEGCCLRSFQISLEE